MEIAACVKSQFGQFDVSVQTNESAKSLQIAPKATGFGAAINGGELLLLSLATCFCNDLYREAAKQSVPVDGVEVRVSGQFGADGEPGTDFAYTVTVQSDAPPATIDALIRHTDQVAEVQNTLRKGINVQLRSQSVDND